MQRKRGAAACTGEPAGGPGPGEKSPSARRVMSGGHARVRCSRCSRQALCTRSQPLAAALALIGVLYVAPWQHRGSRNSVGLVLVDNGGGVRWPTVGEAVRRPGVPGASARARVRAQRAHVLECVVATRSGGILGERGKQGAGGAGGGLLVAWGEGNSHGQVLCPCCSCTLWAAGASVSPNSPPPCGGARCRQPSLGVTACHTESLP